jgi:UDP-3-O-acyl-N-acetylglucosamine deacetylase
VETGGEPVLLTVRAPFRVTEGDAEYVVAPAKALRLTVTIEWPHPLIGRQSGSYTVTAQTFGRELAAARTFGFASEGEALKAKGLIKGASTASAIVLDERGLADGGKLRWPDEFVRHKALDAIGDLALAGAPILGAYRSVCGGHKLNHAILCALIADPTAWTVVEAKLPRQRGHAEIAAHAPAYRADLS